MESGFRPPAPTPELRVRGRSCTWGPQLLPGRRARPRLARTCPSPGHAAWPQEREDVLITCMAVPGSLLSPVMKTREGELRGFLIKTLRVPEAHRKSLHHHWKPSSHQTFINYKKDKLLISPRVELSHSPFVPSSRRVCSQHRRGKAGSVWSAPPGCESHRLLSRGGGRADRSWQEGARRRGGWQIGGPCSQRAGTGSCAEGKDVPTCPGPHPSPCPCG